MYKHGTSPSVSRVQFAFYQEMCQIANAMGIKIAEYTEEQFFSKGSVMGVEYWGPFSDALLPPIVGPDSTEHRYFTEDIPVGTVVYYQLAQKFGVEVPIIESIIRLGSVICKRTLYPARAKSAAKACPQAPAPRMATGFFSISSMSILPPYHVE